jgi:hypothetical protein
VVESVETKHPDDRKVIIIITQEGCPPCPVYTKMATEAAPKGVTVKEIKLGKNEDVDSLVQMLGVQTTPTTLYVEKGELRKTITPTGRAEVDRAEIVNIEKAEARAQSEPVEGCPGIFNEGPEGWKLNLTGGRECEKAVKELQSEGPGTQKNLKRHVNSNDPKVNELLGRLSKA